MQIVLHVAVTNGHTISTTVTSLLHDDDQDIYSLAVRPVTIGALNKWTVERNCCALFSQLPWHTESNAKKSSIHNEIGQPSPQVIMPIRLCRFGISSRRDIIVIDDSTGDCLCLRDLDSLVVILAIIDPPFFCKGKYSIKVSTLVLAVSCKGGILRPKLQICVRVALECLADVVQTVYCVPLSLACRIAVFGGKVVLAYGVLMARISKGIA